MDEEKQMTPAERLYENVRKAQAAYWRRKNPNPKPRGRPKKEGKVEGTPPENKMDEVVEKV
jgi:hypothetical protein